jgi:MFS family permease
MSRSPAAARAEADPAGANAAVIPYLAVLATAFLCYAALGCVLRILPSYVPTRLGGGPVAVGLAVGAPAISAIVSRPLGGRRADRLGTLPVLLTGAAVMAAGGPLGLVPTLPALLLSRLAVGAGEGLMMSAAALWLLRLGGASRRGRSMGHVGLANYGGLVAGPLLAVAVSGEHHPARVFLIATVLPLAAAALVLAVRPAAGAGGGEAARAAPVRSVLAWTLRPGLGLMLVNVGYAALIGFAAAAIGSNGAGGAGLVVPLFAGVVILVRAAAGSLPDRTGPERTLLVSCPLAAAGLALVGLASGTPLVVAGLLAVGVGQALAVPALGVLALRRSPGSQHGATAGLFFAWFDAGVGAGGPAAGLSARSFGPSGALLTAAGALLLAPALALGGTREAVRARDRTVPRRGRAPRRATR